MYFIDLDIFIILYTEAAVKNKCLGNKTIFFHHSKTDVHNLMYSTQPDVQYATLCTVHNLMYSSQPDVQYTTLCTVHNLMYSTQPDVQYTT